jgi:pSer/pThr/pTyr-binding forkhead associated (FHA) protein
MGKENILTVHENGKTTRYRLDDRLVWQVGRATAKNAPDIALHTPTVSRKHGVFKNVDGVWFYIDYNAKNGTAHNGSRITEGFNHMRCPVMLNDGDVLVFGGGEGCADDERTVRAAFTIE